MKSQPFITLILLVLFLTNCKDKNQPHLPDNNGKEKIGLDIKHDSIPYVTLPFDKLNKTIDSIGITDLESLAKAYYLPATMGEGNESYTIFPESNKDPRRVTIIHDDIADDSQRGIKFTILIDEKFNVIEIRKAIRCWPGRGRGYWHGSQCI